VSLPAPRPGLVIRFAFLWSHEAEAGQAEASKDRPCAVVVATRKAADKGVRVIVAPITHEPPDHSTRAFELPPDVARTLGLDADRHWVRVDELNRFSWPGFDLRPIPGRGGFVYGMLPRALFERLRARIVERARKGTARTEDRDD
jgi:hypothetical protein